MAGIYVHIPYCRKACIYCDFHFRTNLSRKEVMVEAICTELQLRQNFFTKGPLLKTIYLGGGTPSVLSPGELSRILAQIKASYTLAEEIEISLEANPDDLNKAYLEALAESGINRLSIGIQSFDDRDLKWMNRSHSAQQAIQCVQDAEALGLHNISIDLIFGLPGMDAKKWAAQLDQAIRLPIHHLSLYALTVEEKTALQHQIQQSPELLPQDAAFTEYFLMAHERLEAAGFEHYELSNYAKSGFRSKHNSAYWEQVPYLGIGPAAHSFDGEKRYWNQAHNQVYLNALLNGQLPPQSEEVLSRKDRYNEYVMTHLRKKSGVNQVDMQRFFAIDWKKDFSKSLDYWRKAGYLKEDEGHYFLNPAGWMMSDAVIRDFFWDDLA